MNCRGGREGMGSLPGTSAIVRTTELSYGEEMQAIALLTCGGDAPGMNACIRAATRAGIERGATVWGVQDGFDGLISPQMEPLTSRGVAGILHRGGTILGAGRCEEFFQAPVRLRCVEHLRAQGIEGLIVIGGDGSLRGAQELHRLGFPVVGVPGSIDNDVPGTELCIGTDTAINTAVEAIDRLRDTASAHHRAMIVEVMGRRSGYIALMASLATGAEMVVVPERPVELQEVFDEMQVGERRGKRHFILVIAEGARWSAAELCQLINEADNPYEARYTVLGYTQRGGSPTAADRILATQMGVAAVDALCEGQSGSLVAWQGGRVAVQSMDEAVAAPTAMNATLERVVAITAT